MTIAAKVPQVAYGTTVAIRFVNNVIGEQLLLAGHALGVAAMSWGNWHLGLALCVLPAAASCTCAFQPAHFNMHAVMPDVEGACAVVIHGADARGVGLVHSEA